MRCTQLDEETQYTANYVRGEMLRASRIRSPDLARPMRRRDT